MAWYKPGRNPDHPGNAPPKWAPLSKAGRLVLLVSVIAGVVIGLMIVATRTTGAADAIDGATNQPSTSSLPTSGQRVEIPEAGMALTIPAGWGFQVEMRPTDWAAGAPVAATIWQVLDSWSPAANARGGRDRVMLGSDCSRSSEQSVGSMMFDGVTGDPGPVADQSAPKWTHSTTEVLLPVGPVTRNDEVGQEPDGVSYSTVYNLVAPDGMVWLNWSGPVRPDHHWLSIAETFEFLPRRSSPEPPCIAGHVWWGLAAVARQLAERSVGRLAPGLPGGRPMQGPRRVGGYPEVLGPAGLVVLGLAEITSSVVADGAGQSRSQNSPGMSASASHRAAPRCVLEPAGSSDGFPGPLQGEASEYAAVIDPNTSVLLWLGAVQAANRIGTASRCLPP